MNGLLEVHITGGRIGESIVLHLPDGKWGVVDCYVPTLAEPTSSSSFRFLQERGVTDLAFLCLTHPDADHCRGMSLFLEKFLIGQFWMFGAKSPSELYQRIAALLKIRAVKLQEPAPMLEEADDFAKTIRLVKAMRQAKKIDYVPMSQGG